MISESPIMLLCAMCMWILFKHAITQDLLSSKQTPNTVVRIEQCY